MKSYLQQPNFKLVFGKPALNDLKMFIQAVTIPEIAIIEDMVNMRVRQQYFSGNDLTYGTLDFSFLVDEDMNNYFAVLDEIHSYKDNSVGTYASKQQQIELIITSNKGSSSNKFILEDCFFVSVSPLEMNYASGEELSCSVTVRFSSMTYRKI